MKGAVAALRMALFLLPSAATASPAPALAERTIRSLRAQYNAALAKHDFAAMRRFYSPDYTALPGSNGGAFNATELGKRISGDFADPTFITYLRTPTRVTIGFSGKRAAEVGRWVGTWRTRGGEMRVTGVYQAMWVPTVTGWRLKNESFVTLGCTGSKRCPEMD